MNSENLRAVAQDIQRAYALPPGHQHDDTFSVYDDDPEEFLDEEDGMLNAPDHFNMGYVLGSWQDEQVGDCGTVGCIATFAAARAMSVVNPLNHWEIEDAAAKWLDLEDAAANHLFAPWQSPHRWFAITLEEACGVLYHVADRVDDGETPKAWEITMAWNSRAELAKVSRCHWCGHRRALRARDQTHGPDCGRPRHLLP